MEQLHQYRELGYAYSRQAFSLDEVTEIKYQLDFYSQQKINDGIVKELDKETLRGINGAHLYDSFFANLVIEHRFIQFAYELIAEPFYVHQSKINVKSKMKGASWPWHQDFVFWANEDGIPEAKMLNVALLLSDVDMLHGPLCVIPKSHKEGNLSKKTERNNNWKSDVSSELSYQLDAETVDNLIQQNGYEYLMGKAGDLILFDPQLAHCSSSNLSPENREFLIITYNPCSNQPTIDSTNGRPDFLCGRDFTPISSINNRA